MVLAVSVGIFLRLNSQPYAMIGVVGNIIGAACRYRFGLELNPKPVSPPLSLCSLPLIKTGQIMILRQAVLCATHVYLRAGIG